MHTMPTFSVLLPQGNSFVAEVPKLIDELSIKLCIFKTDLDKSEDSLAKIDQAVLDMGQEKCLEGEIFALLLAYIGEVVKQQTGGEWEIRLADDGETWEPWIVDARGRYYPILERLYKQLIEHYPDNFSLEGDISALILFGE